MTHSTVVLGLAEALSVVGEGCVFGAPGASFLSSLILTPPLCSCSLVCCPSDQELLVVGGGAGTALSHQGVPRAGCCCPVCSGCALHTSCPGAPGPSAWPGCAYGLSQKPLPHCLWSCCFCLGPTPATACGSAEPIRAQQGRGLLGECLGGLRLFLSGEPVMRLSFRWLIGVGPAPTVTHAPLHSPGM